MNKENDRLRIPDSNSLEKDSCFIAGTKVYTSEGYKNIEDLKIGDLVLTHKNRYRKILEIRSNPNQQIWEIRTLCEKSFYTTENHLFSTVQVEDTHYTDSKFKTVDSLNYDDYLVGLEHIAKYGEMGCSYYIYDKVTSIVKTDVFETVYNLKVEEDNTYVVNDRVVGGIVQ